MPEIHLICEGEGRSLDERVLSALLVGVLNVPVTIRRAGGGSSLPSVQRFIEEHSRQKKKDGSLGQPRDAVFSIEDRDFEPIEKVNRAWSDDSRKLCMHRHEIENYLLEPRVILGAFRSFRETVDRPWAQALPITEAAVSTLLRRAAEACLDAYVAGVVHRAIHVACREAGSLSFRMERPRLPDDRPVQLRDWVEAFQREAARLRVACGNVGAGLEMLEGPCIAAAFAAVQQRVEDPTFFADGHFLAEMEGKALLKSLLIEIHRIGQGRGPSREDLEDELINALDAAYREGGLFNPDTFLLLRDRLTAAGTTRRGPSP